MDLENSEENTKSFQLVGKNAIIYAAGNIGMRAAAFLLIPLYTHGLSISGYGFLATLQLTMQAMMGFMNSGMRISLMRFTQEFKEKNNLGELIGTSTVINIFVGVIVSIVALSFLINFFRNVLHAQNVYSYIELVCIATLVQSLVFHLMAYYRAEEQALKFMLTGVLSSIVLILINSVFLYGFHLGIMGALWASIITYVFFLLFLVWDIFPKTGVTLSVKLISRLLHFGFPLIFSELALLVMGGVSVYFISYYFGLESVAIFSLGSKLASVLVMIVILPFQLAFQPFIFLNLNKEDIKETISRLLTYLVLIITLMFFFILFSSRLLLPIIAPPEYSSAFFVILLLLPGIAFIGIYYIGETLLGAVKKTYLIGFLMSLFVIVSILLNYFLIPIMDWYGAIVASNCCYVLSGLIFLALGKKYFPFSIEWKRISVCGCIVIFFFLFFLALSKVTLLVFTVLSLLAGLVSILMLFRLKFFSSEEKILLRELLPIRAFCEK